MFPHFFFKLKSRVCARFAGEASAALRRCARRCGARARRRRESSSSPTRSDSAAAPSQGHEAAEASSSWDDDEYECGGDDGDAEEELGDEGWDGDEKAGLVMHNDDVHTFNEIMAPLQLLGFSARDGRALALQAHDAGEAVLRRGASRRMAQLAAASVSTDAGILRFSLGVFERG